MCVCGAATALTEADRAAIHRLDSAYVNAWLADDTASVLATLDDRIPVVFVRKDSVTTEATGHTMTLTVVARGGDSRRRIPRRMWGPLAR